MPHSLLPLRSSGGVDMQRRRSSLDTVQPSPFDRSSQRMTGSGLFSMTDTQLVELGLAIGGLTLLATVVAIWKSGADRRADLRSDAIDSHRKRVRVEVRGKTDDGSAVNVIVHNASERVLHGATVRVHLDDGSVAVAAPPATDIGPLSVSAVAVPHRGSATPTSAELIFADDHRRRLGVRSTGEWFVPKQSLPFRRQSEG